MSRKDYHVRSKTRHAEDNQRRRSICDHAITLIEQYGWRYFAGDGCIAIYLGKKAVAAARQFGVCLDAYRNQALILDPDGTVVTVMHARRPLRKWRGRR